MRKSRLVIVIVLMFCCCNNLNAEPTRFGAKLYGTTINATSSRPSYVYLNREYVGLTPCSFEIPNKNNIVKFVDSRSGRSKTKFVRGNVGQSNISLHYDGKFKVNVIISRIFQREYYPNSYRLYPGTVNQYGSINFNKGCTRVRIRW